ncbi:MAG: hypothetical protein N2606_04075 [Candidatus Omnitrophica bacterium]|nr:hypothetical protein [Candidatus Omnitrophota bacterium]
MNFRFDFRKNNHILYRYKDFFVASSKIYSNKLDEIYLFEEENPRIVEYDDSYLVSKTDIKTYKKDVQFTIRVYPYSNISINHTVYVYECGFYCGLYKKGHTIIKPELILERYDNTSRIPVLVEKNDMIFTDGYILLVNKLRIMKIELLKDVISECGFKVNRYAVKKYEQLLELISTYVKKHTKEELC